MPHAPINGFEMFYGEAGSGAPIVIHPGWTGAHDAWWDLIVPRLRDRYHCIVMDPRGAGDSSHPADGYTIEQCARDVVGLADYLGLRTFTYLGHSMGGLIGFELGISHADRLDKLILVAPTPADGFPASQVPAGESYLRQVRERDRDSMIKLRMLTAIRDVDPAQVALLVDRTLSVSDGHLEQLWREQLTTRRGDRLREITTPTLVVAGAADMLLPDNLRDFSRLPNATLHVFSRVGHGVPSDLPDAFAEVVADFMEHGVVVAGTVRNRVMTLEAAT
jgi:pimeloyl-ACP methyl ester carboxylesterase